MNPFKEMLELFKSLEEDFEKFYEKGNGAAGTRVRKGMQDLKNKAHDVRKEVQDMKNAVAAGSKANDVKSVKS